MFVITKLVFCLHVRRTSVMCVSTIYRNTIVSMVFIMTILRIYYRKRHITNILNMCTNSPMKFSSLIHIYIIRSITLCLVSFIISYVELRKRIEIHSSEILILINIYYENDDIFRKARKKN